MKTLRSVLSQAVKIYYNYNNLEEYVCYASNKKKGCIYLY